MKDNTTNIEAAKRIFCKYNGSYFQMARDEVYDTYKEYHIPKQLEILWMNELIENYIFTIQNENNDSKLTHTLSNLYYIIVNYKHKRGYRSMIELIKEKINSCSRFTQLLMAEYILETIKDFHCENVDIKNVEYALGILKSIAEESVTNSVYGKQTESLDGIRERAKEDIIEWENYHSPRKRRFYKIKKYLKKHQFAII